MVYRIEVRLRRKFGDPHAHGTLGQIRELGIHSVKKVQFARLFFLAGQIKQPDLERVAARLLADPVTEEYYIGTTGAGSTGAGSTGVSPVTTEDTGGTPVLPRVPPKIIEVHLKLGVMDPVAASTEQAIRDMGLSVQAVRTARRYELLGEVTREELAVIARRLLANDCIEDAHFASHTPPEAHGSEYKLAVRTVPIRKLSDAGLEKLSKERDLFLNVTEMQAIQRHYQGLGREPSDIEVEMIAQTWSEHCGHKTFRSDVSYEGTPIPGWPAARWVISGSDDLRQQAENIRRAMLDSGYAGDHLEDWGMAGIRKEIEAVGASGSVVVEIASGNEGEARLFANGKELLGFSCMDLENGKPLVKLKIPNLIKSTVFAVTAKLNKPWCISVFKDNAGVIEFDDEWAVCLKVETHNHPSALDPYGGAGTGIGGVIRDPMGTGMGAFPVANTDVFCFGPPDMPLEAVPKGVLHPRRIMRGVVAGVRDYGNRMGIPTVNGAVYFDERYLGNPLVFCGTVGLLPRDKCFKQPLAGDAVLVVGGRTGRDGIHGATFSSGELTHEHETEFSGAVQIGNAITEKKMLDTLIQARDEGLYTAITDCGAGGLSSAVGEMGEELGAEVHLERVPLKYQGLSYHEIWISEAQERMVLSVPPENVERILKLFAAEGVEATVIGHFGVGKGATVPTYVGISRRAGQSAGETPATRGRPLLRLFYSGQLVGELDMDFLQNGLPRPTKLAVWQQVARSSPRLKARKDYSRTLLKILGSPNVASKEWIIRQYDHEVQGGSVVKPLVGVTGDGPGDAAVIRPVLASRRGLVISCGMNPRLGDLDPYQSALHAIDEALRNCVAVGGDLERTAILDNFCWGNCNKPDRMGSFVQAAKACYDGALAYGVPFISGKDSLNNEFQTDDGRTIAIPPTLLISALSVIQDVGRCVTADAKAAGNALFLVGRTTGHLGGSHFLLVERKASGTDVPPVDVAQSRAAMAAVQQAIAAGLVRACHDLSEGGLAVAAAEMAFSGGLGVEIDVRQVPLSAAGILASAPHAVLFAENAGRFLAEVAPENRARFTELMKGLPAAEIGKVTDTGRIVFTGRTGTLIDVTIDEAKKAWQKTFDW